MPKRWIEFLYRHPVLNFVLMAFSFLVFGWSSVNLFVQLKMNIELFINYGWMVVEDGALQQLFELVGAAFVSIAFLVLYKIGEKVLVDRLTEKKYGEYDADRARRPRAAPSGDPAIVDDGS